MLTYRSSEDLKNNLCVLVHMYLFHKFKETVIIVTWESVIPPHIKGTPPAICIPCAINL